MQSPVIYNFFIRPEVAKKVFEQIRLAKPRTLYLFSDGGRNEFEKELVKQNRKQIDGMIDWNCDVFKFYYETNIGMDKIFLNSFKEVFKNHDRVIVLEEDILPSISFFRFCDELLEKYLNDERIYMIGGMNFKNEYPINSNISYYFQETVSTWGFAFWKRTYEKTDYSLDNLKDEYLREVILNNLKKKGKINHYKHLLFKLDYPDSKIIDGEFWLMGYNDNVLNNSIAIRPSVNLVRNIGNTINSEHSDELKLLPKKMRKASYLDLKEMTFPLVHPKYFIVDYGPQKLTKQIKEFTFKDKVERGLRILMFRGPKAFMIKFKKYLKKNRSYYNKLKRYK